jgi:Domain of unknown function (DUF4214)
MRHSTRKLLLPCLALVALLAGCASAPPSAPRVAEVPICATVSADPGTRIDCALQTGKAACTEGTDYVGPIASALGVHPLLINRGFGRHRIIENNNQEWCDLEEGAQRAALQLATTPKKVRSEANREWQLFELGAGPDGTPAVAGFTDALATRRALLEGSDRAKRAGLPAQISGWTNLTGYTQTPGRVNDLYIDAANASRMLAGTDGGGIWQTTDAGVTWAPVNDFSGSLSIGNFALAPNTPSVIYAGTNPLGSHGYAPFGVLKSSDGGQTWSALTATNPANNPDWTYVTRIAVHPTNANELLAAVGSFNGGGVYQSLDGGATWSKLFNGSASYVAIHPTDVNRRIAALNDGTVWVTASGATAAAGWNNVRIITPAQFTSAYTKLALARTDPARVYALVSNAGMTELWASTTFGAAWQKLIRPPDNLGVIYDQDYLRFTGGLMVDPTNADKLTMWEAWAATTTNAMLASPTWKRAGCGWVDYHAVLPHPAFNGSSNRIVFGMDDGGIYRFNDVDTFDTAGACTGIASGMTHTQVYSVAGSGGNVIMGAQDVAPRVHRDLAGTSGKRWQFLRNPATNGSWIGDGMTTAADPTNPLVLYGSRQYLDFFRSADGGITASALCGNLNEGRCGGNTTASFIAPFVVDPVQPARLYAGGRSVWRTNDAAAVPPVWTVVRAPFTPPNFAASSNLVAISVARSDPNVVWIAYASGHVFKTANALAATPIWTEITARGSNTTLRILIDRTNANRVFLGFSGFFANRLAVSNDGGATFSNVTGLPSAPVYAIAQHPLNAARLYVGTGVGLFASDDNGATWSTSNEGPANVTVRDLHWATQSTDSAELLVATFGRGVWRATVPANAMACDTAVATGDCDADGIPNGIEAQVGRNPHVKDNDIFGDSRLFVMQMYRDFLTREGDAAGVNFWVGRIDRGERSRAQMAEEYVNSNEFQGRIAPIVRLQFAINRAIPTFATVFTQVAQRDAGMSIEALGRATLAASPLAGVYNGRAEAEFIATAYADLLGRAPTTAENAAAVAAVASVGRGGFLAQLANTQDYANGSMNNVYVTMMYMGMLRRGPEQGGFDFWVGVMRAGQSGLGLVQAFLDAAEYRNRFLP